MNPFNTVTNRYRFTTVSISMRSRVQVTIYDPQGLLACPPDDASGMFTVIIITRIIRLSFITINDDVILDPCLAWSTLNTIQCFENISCTLFNGEQPWMVSIGPFLGFFMGLKELKGRFFWFAHF